MDTRHTVRGYNETASALSDEVEQVAPVDNHLQALQSITEQLLRLQTDAAERERRQDIEMAERRKREAEERKEAQAMEMAKIDAQLKLEEQKIQIQMDMEKARLAQDKELAEQRMARDDARLRRTELDQIAKNITPWQDHDQPAPFLRKFEDCMMAAEIPRDHWPKRLLPLLTGKAATAYTCHVPTEAKDDYPKLREAMLTAMGKSKDACRRQFWNYRRKPMEPLTEVLRDLQWMTTRLLEDCKSMEEATAVMTTGKFLSLFSLEDADYVRQRKPSTTLDYANFMTDRMEMRQQSGDPRPHRYWQPRPDNRPPYLSDARKEPLFPYPEGNYQPSPFKHEPTSRPLSPTNRRPDGPRGGGQDTIVCYGCGQKGHKRPDCPRQVRRIASPRPTALYLTGSIGSTTCKNLLIDTGSVSTIVHPRLVTPEDYTGETTTLSGFGSSPQDWPLAKIRLCVGNHTNDYIVAVSDWIGHDDAYLGMDLGLLDYLIYVEKQQRAHSTEVRVTRAQDAKDQAVQQSDWEATDQSGAAPIPLGDIYDFDDTLFQSNSVEPAQVQAVPDASLPEQEPLPDLTHNPTDKADLIQQQKEDSTLAPLRLLAEENNKGYSWEDGLLIHNEVDDFGTDYTRIVLPTQRRQSVLKLAHSSLTGGHFGRKKTQAKIRHHFTWPGVTTDVQQFCQTCPECQKAAPHTHQRAPLQPLPVITTPFAKIAFDIVGPLPKTKSGFKYLLTSMCYASKYPEAIPLKRVTAEVVAEAMLEVFSRTGLPEHILTDQGSVFVGRIINHLCHLLGIHHIRTSPYHPQSDGMLERWHASLKAMLNKVSPREDPLVTTTRT